MGSVWKWLKKKAFLFGMCLVASPFVLLLWNLVNFAFVGLVLQMVPEMRAPVAPVVALNPPGDTKPHSTDVNPPAADIRPPSRDESIPLLKVYSLSVLYGLLPIWFVIAIVLFFLIVQPLVGYAEGWLNPLATAPPNTSDNELEGKLLVRLISQYRVRALFARAGALLMVIFVIALLLVGLLIFVSADRLASAEGPTHTDVPFIVSTLATRIGAVLILFFLVKNLAVLYRYSILLVGFYDSRADALQLVGKKSPAELKKFIEMLSPSISFDELPKSPVEELAGVVGPAAEATKKVLGISSPAGESHKS